MLFCDFSDHFNIIEVYQSVTVLGIDYYPVIVDLGDSAFCSFSVSAESNGTISVQIFLNKLIHIEFTFLFSFDYSSCVVLLPAPGHHYYYKKHEKC